MHKNIGNMKNIFNLNKSISLTKNPLKEILILGASGSVGRQAFELCISNPDKFKIKTLVSGKNVDETIRQALIAQPEYIVMADEVSAEKVRTAVGCKVLWGDSGRDEVISFGYDIAITAIPGIDGLEATFKAIAHSKVVAFANKETIIYAGEKLIEEAEKHKTAIIPIDSEHNAIFQILDGINQSHVEQIILTASGGPLLNRVDMDKVTVEDVLKHPTWNMGKKITVDCATLMNKALEVIEASYLFGRNIDEIEIIVHPESIIHGMVRLKDGSLLMHSAPADMKLPLSYAINWPEVGSFNNNLDLIKVGKFTFLEPSYKKFPLFKLAINAAKKSIESRVIMNYANEIAVNLFLDSKISFKEIYEVVEFALNANIKFQGEKHFSDLRNMTALVKKAIFKRFL